MKKIFAIVLTLAVILVGFTAQANVTSFSEKTYPPNSTMSTGSEIAQNKEAHFEECARRIIDAEVGYPEYQPLSLISSIKTNKLEDGKLTISLINQMSSWDELVNTAIPLSSDYKNIENFEDKYCVMLIDGINNKPPLSVPIYHDELYIAFGLTGINLYKVDFDRLMNKFIAIINLYNNAGDLYLMWDYKIPDNCFMQIYVYSPNYIWLCNPAKEVGQRVVMRPNAKYFESAWNDGSGTFGIVKFPAYFNIENDLFPDNCVVTVNGVAYLDENWECVLESYYTPYSELKKNELEIKTSARRMLHICTETTDLGWVHTEDVMRIEDFHIF